MTSLSWGDVDLDVNKIIHFFFPVVMKLYTFQFLLFCALA